MILIIHQQQVEGPNHRVQSEESRAGKQAALGLQFVLIETVITTSVLSCLNRRET